MRLFGFIGVGNMGYSMIKATVDKIGKDTVTYYDVSKVQIEKVQHSIGILPNNNIQELVEKSRYIILAIKPQYYNGILGDMKEWLTDKHVLISIAPGITINQIKGIVGSDVKIVRTMPNTPAMVGEGMTAYCYSDDLYSNDEKKQLEEFLNCFGLCEELSENLMDVAVCASGSSPAYVYLFIEALADSVVKYGLTRDVAYKLVAQTILGSAKMVLETGEHPGQLKDKVCSPGGTTIEGIAALEEYGFRNAIIKATDACFNKVQDIKSK